MMTLSTEARQSHASIESEPDRVQDAINAAFNGVAATLNEELKVGPLYDDRAEELVAAIYRYLNECRSETDYRFWIEEIAGRYAKTGENWKAHLLAGSPDRIDREEAKRIATWLIRDADQEWGADDRHHRIAADILDLLC